MQISVLGMGRMGQAIADRLIDTGHEVTVWNRTPSKTTPLVAHGASAAGSIAEAVQSADVVMTLLTDDSADRQVYLGDDGVLAHLQGQTILVDMSTVSPNTSRQLAETAPTGRFIDAPILGGPDVTREGQAKLLLGGAEKTVHGLDRLWRDVSSGSFYTGPNGTATTMKLLSNLILIGSTIFMSEAVATAEANGIKEHVLRQVLGQSPAVAPGVRVRLDDVLAGDHEGWWTIRLAEKDLNLALDLARQHGLQLSLGSEAEQVLKRTDHAGYGDKDLGAVVELARESPMVRRY